jgi:hypothetical protein
MGPLPQGGFFMAIKKMVLPLIIVVFLAALSGCATKRPVLYPNDMLQQVGKTQSQADIDYCLQFAEEHGAKENTGGKIVKDSAGSALVGAAAGAAMAAVFGGDIGESAAVGAAGAGAATATRGVINSGDPDAVFRSFVEKCLREKGYEPTGWR